MPRFKTQRIFRNSSPFYEFLRRNRGDVKAIMQYTTPILINPSVRQRADTAVDNYIWRYGDRYYKLANKYYQSPSYWWVIAQWNALPTEADIRPGDIISIPLDLEQALEILGSF